MQKLRGIGKDNVNHLRVKISCTRCIFTGWRSGQGDREGVDLAPFKELLENF